MNEQQRAAAFYTGGPILVLAGAGSGKTYTLVERVKYLVKEKQIPLERIMVVTFTNKAADEMLERISNVISISRNYIGTFHSIAARFLRVYGKEIDVSPNFTIITETDKAKLIKKIAEEYIPRSEVTKNFINTVLLDISTYKNNAQLPDDLIKKDVTYHIYNDYLKELKKNNLQDFDDLLLNFLHLLRSPAGEKVKQSFDHVIVDEFQDTNYVQYLILKELFTHIKDIFVVGDDDQAIYGFRGAVPGIVQMYQEEFDAHIVKLEQNYRSTKAIIGASNMLILHNVNRMDKMLYTRNPMGSAPVVKKFSSDREEAHFIISTIKRLIREKRYSYSDFAVLYRTHALSDTIKQALTSAYIPIQDVDGFDLFQRKEIKDIIAILTLIVNPHDSFAFERMVGFPGRISPKWKKNITVTAKLENISYYAAANRLLRFNKHQGVSKFIENLNKLRKKAQKLDILSIVRQVISMFSFTSKYAKEPARLHHIGELVNIVKHYSEMHPDASLHDLLTYLSLGKVQTEQFDAVNLLTVHSAKGLEFPVVFVIGMEEGNFPHYLNKDIEEERRLFYVAITRAKERLYMCGCVQRYLYANRKIFDNYSRFLDELKIPA